MQPGVAGRVEDGQQDQADGADDGEEDGEAREHLLTHGRVGHEAALMAQPAVGAERDVEEDGGDDAAGDEERLEPAGADVADVGDALPRCHGGVVLAAPVDDPVQQQAEERAEPDDAGDDGEDLRPVSEEASSGRAWRRTNPVREAQHLD